MGMNRDIVQRQHIENFLCLKIKSCEGFLESNGGIGFQMKDSEK